MSLCRVNFSKLWQNHSICRRGLNNYQYYTLQIDLKTMLVVIEASILHAARFWPTLQGRSVVLLSLLGLLAVRGGP